MTATRIFSVLLSFLFMIMLPKLPIRLMAQDSATGAIRGIVLDATGSRVAQASVVVVNTATGVCKLLSLIMKVRTVLALSVMNSVKLSLDVGNLLTHFD